MSRRDWRGTGSGSSTSRPRERGPAASCSSSRSYAVMRALPFAWRARGYQARDPNLRFIRDPAFTPLRADPRFHELACKLDLPPGVCAGSRK